MTTAERWLFLFLCCGALAAAASWAGAQDATSREFIVYVDSISAGNATSREHIAYIDQVRQADATSREFIANIGQVPLSVGRQWRTGRPIYILPSVVTARFRGFFYVEAADRSAGIMVRWDEGVSVGWLVEIAGVTGITEDGERCIDATDVVLKGVGSVAPLSLRPGWLGGGDFEYSASEGLGQRGTQAYSFLLERDVDLQGLNNIGLLVRVWGRACWIGSGSFVIDDGSGSLYGDPSAPGVKVLLPIGASPPSKGSWVMVTGISSCYSNGKALYRLIRARDASDILVVQ